MSNAEEGPGEALLLGFVGRRLVVLTHGEGVRPLPSGDIAKLGRAVPDPDFDVTDVGPWQGSRAAAVDLSDQVDLPDGARLMGLRELHRALPRDLHRVAGRALQLLEWRRTNRYCGRCGAATIKDRAHPALTCPECGQRHFPRLAPAVITLVERGDRMLLGRSVHFPPGVYSTLAGFVDLGESVEEAVRREVMEEAGIRVADLRYFGSQPWPFPHSLMLGFVAQWAGGEIDLGDGELEDARWFTSQDLPRALPSSMSIARSLVDDFLRRHGHKAPEDLGEAPHAAYSSP